MAVLRPLVLLFWLALGSYVGVSGWLGCKSLEGATVSSGPSAGTAVLYHGISFQNESELNGFLSEESEARWSPWLYNLPGDLWPLIASLGLGLVGGAARLLKNCAMDKASLDTLPLYSGPLFGAVLGVLLFYLALLVPTVMVIGGNRVRASSLAAFSLFGGVFSEQTFAWLEKQYKDVLSKFGKK
jgi:hypothetical protein